MGSPPTPAATVADAAQRLVIRPMRTLWLLSIAHAVNHAQAVILPLIYIQITQDYDVGVETIAFLAAFGSFASGAVQLSYASLTRRFQRRNLLGAGGLLFGGGFVAQAFAQTFGVFAVGQRAVEDRRLTAAPGRQRPAVGAVPARAPRLRHQRPYRRRQRRDGRRRAGRGSHHRGRRLAWGVDRVRRPGDPHRDRDPAADPRDRHGSGGAVASGTVRQAFGRIVHDRDMLWVYLTSVLGGGGRGLGVVNLFVLIYLTDVIGLDPTLIGLM